MIVCADDFGISAGVNQAILDLVRRRVVSAVSCLVVFSDWRESARALKPLAGQIDVGLHFMKPRGLGNKNVDDEIRRQYELFASALEIAPNFIDGHRHVQQLPPVSSALIRFLKSHPRVYTRNSWSSIDANQAPLDQAKAWAIGLPGYVWKKRIEWHGLPTNDGFAGVYALGKKLDVASVREKFKKFPRSLSSVNGMWMVHPGIPDAALATRDDFVEGRQLEYDVLKSAEFQNHLRENQIQINRFVFRSSTTQ